MQFTMSRQVTVTGRLSAETLRALLPEGPPHPAPRTVMFIGRKRVPLLTGHRPVGVSRVEWARRRRVNTMLRRRECRHGIPARTVRVTVYLPSVHLKVAA